MAGKINELVTDEALAKLDKLIADLAIANRSMADAIQLANQYTAAIGGSKNLADFVKNQEKAAEAIKKVQEKIDETRVAEQNLSTEREKLTKKQIENERKLQEMAEKRKRVVTEGTAAEIAAAESRIREENRVISTTMSSTAAANSHAAAIRNDVAEEARAEAVAARYRQARLSATQATQASTAALAAGTQAVAANEAATTTSMANIGRSLTRGLGYLRTLAYVLPGIGIAGLFNLAFEGIMKVVNSLELFKGKIEALGGLMKNFNEINKDASKEYGQQSTKLKILYSAATDVENSMHNRLLAVLELKKEFPNTFENLTNEAILNGKVSASYKELTESILQNAMAKASYEKIAKLAAVKAEADIQIKKLEIATVNDITRAYKEANGVRSYGIGGSGAQTNAALKSQSSFERNTDKIAEQQAIKASAERQIKFFMEMAGGNNKIALAITEDNAKKLNDITTKAAKQLNNDELELQRARLTGEKEAAKLILDNDESTYEARLEALKVFVEKSKKLIENENEIADRAPGITPTRVKINAQNATNQNAQVDNFELNQRQKINDEILAGEKAAAKQILEEYKVLEQRKEAIIEGGLNQQLLDLEYANSEEMLQLTKKYSNGEIREKEYRRKMKALQKDSAAEAIDIQVKALEEILAAQEEANTAASQMGLPYNIDTQPTKNKITGLKIKSNQLKTGADSDNAIGDLAKLKESAEEVLLFSQQAVNALNIVGDLIKANAQAKIDALEKEFALIQQNGNADKERINNSLLSNKEKARQTTLIDNQIAQQRAKITQEENEAKRRQAVFDKANAVASILQNTAVAVVKALPNVFLAAIIGALGAAQLATVIATPLPQFYKGTKNAPEGFAHVGERGTELQINPDGSLGLTPNTDTISYLQRGTQIIPHEELMAMVAKPQPIYNIGGKEVDNRKIEKLLEENNELQKRKPATVVKVIADKWGTYEKRNY